MKHLIHTMAAAAALMGAASAQAGIGNGGFEEDLAHWMLSGDGAVSAGYFGAAPTEGLKQLVLTTAAAAYADDAPWPVGHANVSGAEPTAAGFALEAFAGVAPGALDPDAATALQAYEGSAVRQSFAAAAGATLRLRFNFLTTEAGAANPLADYAFAVIDGTVVRLASTADAASPLAGFGMQTGYATFSHTFAAGGTHELVLGVVDVGDYERSSALLVDGIQLAAPVPEPATLALMGLGLAALGVARRRARG